MKRILKGTVAVTLALALAACTSPSTVHSVLSAQGFTQITPQGYALFGCGQDDTFRTKFTAVSATGKPVTGVVCSGLFKGATVRFH